MGLLPPGKQPGLHPELQERAGLSDEGTPSGLLAAADRNGIVHPHLVNRPVVSRFLRQTNRRLLAGHVRGRY